MDWIIEAMGRPERVAPFLKATRDQPGHVKNNTLAVLEYSHAFATVGVCNREAGGNGRRRLTVRGTRGTAELCPLECFDGRPLRLELLLREGNEAFPAGAHALSFGAVRDRYESLLLDFARVIRGEIRPAHDARHDCLVHEAVLAASGYTEWRQGD